MTNDLLREEFNRWAEAGRGEHMEEDHLPIALPMLDRMNIRAEDNILDVGCGAGSRAFSPNASPMAASSASTFPTK
jgi:hypothetical protein